MIHRDIDLRGRGYDPIAPITQDMPGVGRLLRVAREKDVPIESITAFRIGTDMWCIYQKPGEWGAYVSEPML